MAAKNLGPAAPFFCGAGVISYVPATVDHLTQRVRVPFTSSTRPNSRRSRRHAQVLVRVPDPGRQSRYGGRERLSMYDGSTGTGEAVLMAHRITKRRKASCRAVSIPITRKWRRRRPVWLIGGAGWR